ncbi:MAG: protein kinase domain-containing protein, partial [Planctomycetota bacterium]
MSSEARPGMARKRRMFGEIAVAKGFCSEAQLEQALYQQREDEVDSARRRNSIEGYEIVSKLGKGGMGAVYLARQLSLDKLVAIKILPPKFANNRDYLARFKKEANATARLNHPNIVGAFDVGESGGYHYFVMEYVEGETIKCMLTRQGIIEESRAIEIVVQLADALRHAWDHGIVHRDIKPANIMVNPQGTPKLCDLGLAIHADEENSITRSGVIMGTPYYLSPEQARSARLDIRSDIYSLGATFFHMITGRVPYEGNTPAVVITKHVNDPPPDPLEINPVLSNGLCYIVAKMMAKRPDERYQAPDELLLDLRELAEQGRLDGRRYRRHRPVGALTGTHQKSNRRGVLAAVLAPVALLAMITALEPDLWRRLGQRAYGAVTQRAKELPALGRTDEEVARADLERRASRALEAAEREVEASKDDPGRARHALEHIVVTFPQTRAAERATAGLVALTVQLEMDAKSAFFDVAVQAREHRENDRFEEARSSLTRFPLERFDGTTWAHQVRRELIVVDEARARRAASLLEEARARAHEGRLPLARSLFARARALGAQNTEAVSAELAAFELGSKAAPDDATDNDSQDDVRRDALLREAVLSLMDATSTGGLDGAHGRLLELTTSEHNGPITGDLVVIQGDLDTFLAARERELDRLISIRGQRVTLEVAGVVRTGAIQGIKGGRVLLRSGSLTVGYPIRDLGSGAWLTGGNLASEGAAARLR